MPQEFPIGEENTCKYILFILLQTQFPLSSLIKVLIELLQTKNIPEQCIYIYYPDASCLRNTVKFFFHRVVRDKETKLTICRFTQLTFPK